MLTPKSFIKANSQIDLQRYAAANPKQLSRLESLKGRFNIFIHLEYGLDFILN